MICIIDLKRIVIIANCSEPIGWADEKTRTTKTKSGATKVCWLLVVLGSWFTKGEIGFPVQLSSNRLLAPPFAASWEGRENKRHERKKRCKVGRISHCFSPRAPLSAAADSSSLGRRQLWSQLAT